MSERRVKWESIHGVDQNVIQNMREIAFVPDNYDLEEDDDDLSEANEIEQDLRQLYGMGLGAAEQQQRHHHGYKTGDLPLGETMSLSEHSSSMGDRSRSTIRRLESEGFSGPRLAPNTFWREVAQQCGTSHLAY